MLNIFWPNKTIYLENFKNSAHYKENVERDLRNLQKLANLAEAGQKLSPLIRNSSALAKEGKHQPIGSAVEAVAASTIATMAATMFGVLSVGVYQATKKMSLLESNRVFCSLINKVSMWSWIVPSGRQLDCLANSIFYRLQAISYQSIQFGIDYKFPLLAASLSIGTVAAYIFYKRDQADAENARKLLFKDLDQAYMGAALTLTRVLRDAQKNQDIDDIEKYRTFAKNIDYNLPNMKQSLDGCGDALTRDQKEHLIHMVQKAVDSVLGRKKWLDPEAQCEFCRKQRNEL